MRSMRLESSVGVDMKCVTYAQKMSISQLCSPVIIYWFQFLSDDSGIRALRTCSRIYALRKRYEIKRVVDFQFIGLYDHMTVSRAQVGDASHGLPTLSNYSTIVDLELDNCGYLPLRRLVLPPRLQHLRLGFWYHQPLFAGIFPESLKSLRFGVHFNQPLAEHVLPDGLTKLIFGFFFNQEIAQNILPSSLKHLVFGRFFNHDLGVNVLPAALTSLGLGEDYTARVVVSPSLASVIIGETAITRPFSDRDNIVELC